MRMFWYVVWSFVQQFILQDYFLYRLRRLTANITFAVIATAFLFALAHLPNLLLTIAALFWGITSCALFTRLSRHLLTWRGACPSGSLHRIYHSRRSTSWNASRFGIRDLSSNTELYIQRNQSSLMVSTKAWVIAEARI